MKYKCPTCGTVFEGKLEHCPRCGRPMKYRAPEPKQEAAASEEAKQNGPVVNVVVNNNLPAPVEEEKSYFDGKLIQLIGWTLLGGLLTIVTIGICMPVALCMVYRWEKSHTVINGRRLAFDGRGGQLIGKWILWILLSIVTLTIFAWFIPMKLQKWLVSHTHFAA